MTSTTMVDVGQQTVQPETVPSIVSRDEAIKAIVAKVGTFRVGRRKVTCDAGLAGRTLDWIKVFVDESRANGYQTCYPTAEQMRTDEYRVFDRIMPHGATPAPNSAADLVGRHLLDASLDETAIMHDQSDEPGSPRYCTVQVCLGVIR